MEFWLWMPLLFASGNGGIQCAWPERGPFHPASPRKRSPDSGSDIAQIHAKYFARLHIAPRHNKPKPA